MTKLNKVNGKSMEVGMELVEVKGNLGKKK
jgi:hypothetical protein